VPDTFQVVGVAATGPAMANTIAKTSDRATVTAIILEFK
jgi:hypothetical protein